MANSISYGEAFFKILTQPKETMRALVDNDPGYGKWVLIPVYTFLAGFNPTFYLMGLKFLPPWAALLAEIFVMMVFGIFFFWFNSIANFLIGKWLGGKGTLGAVATAYAWAYVPCFGGLVLMQLGQIPKWSMILGGETDLRMIAAAGNILALLTMLPAFAFFAWSWVLMAFGISEAHRFSVGKGFGTVGIFFGLLLVIGVLFGILLVVFVLGGMRS